MSYNHIFFEGWPQVIRAALCGMFGYLALVVLLRASGKRTLAKMNAFDLVVTVAMGSILATVTLSKDVALAEGVTALAVLIGLQFIVSWLAVRWKPISGLVKAEPALLFHRGQWLNEAMRRERVDEGEVRAAIRSQGSSSLEVVEAVVLETDGSFSVILSSSPPGDSALADVQGFSAA